MILKRDEKRLLPVGSCNSLKLVLLLDSVGVG